MEGSLVPINRASSCLNMALNMYKSHLEHMRRMEEWKEFTSPSSMECALFYLRLDFLLHFGQRQPATWYTAETTLQTAHAASQKSSG